MNEKNQGGEHDAPYGLDVDLNLDDYAALSPSEQPEPVAWRIDDLILTNAEPRFTTDGEHARRMDEYRYEGERTARVTALYAQPSEQTGGGGDDMERCPICMHTFRDGDLCATDVELGSCHAGCLSGSPVVNLDAGEPFDGPAFVFVWGSDEAIPVLAALSTPEVGK